MEKPPALIQSSVLRRSFLREFPIAVRGQGVYVWDAEGKRYLDFSGSAAVNFIGHGVNEVAAAMIDQAANLEFVHSSQFTTRAAEEYAQELLDFAGQKFQGGRVYFTSGGSEAVETALKLARQYQVEAGQPQRYKILSRDQSYHGSTLGALGVSGNRRRREIFLPMVREFPHVRTPYCYRCPYDCHNCAGQLAAEVERAIQTSEEEIAAFILEPVSGATLGAAVPPEGYLQQIAQTCQRYGVLLIADEVMTGMGRVGWAFAVDKWAVAPDILVTAKGLTSGYAPLGAVIANRRVVDAIASGSGAFIHGFTYNAHPLSVAVGRTVLRCTKTKRLVQAANSEQEGTAANTLSWSLGTLRDLNVVGDIRGLGLLWGIEFIREKASRMPFPPELNFSRIIGQAAAERGLLVYPMQGCVDGISGDHVLLAPPAVIDDEQISWAVRQLRNAIEAASARNPDVG
jgi:adenosylmethionine-8-amino-7-oxononanoate aminotransferase